MAIYTIRLPERLARQLDDLKYRAARPARKADPIDLLDKLVNYPGSNVTDLGSRGEYHLGKLFRERRRRRSR